MQKSDKSPIVLTPLSERSESKYQDFDDNFSDVGITLIKSANEEQKKSEKPFESKDNVQNEFESS